MEKQDKQMALYDCFYTPPELQAQKQEIDECHQALSGALGKPERRLVLQIIDAKDRIAEETSIDSFIAGFELAWKLSVELNHYENERSVSCQTAMGSGARFASKEEESNRQTTLRMDRHETIVAERYETFRYYCIVGVLG